MMDGGRNSDLHNAAPAEPWSRVRRSVRADEGQRENGRICPTMPCSSERRCKGQGAEVRRRF